MNVIQKGLRYLTDFSYRTTIKMNRGDYNNLSDEDYLKIRFRATTHQKLDLDNPATFNEKMQWLKLYNRRPEYTVMVDKYGVKQYVAEKLNPECVIPTIGVWDNVEDIKFDSLPERFVLKCTHDSGGVVICTDRSSFSEINAKEKLKKSLNRDFYLMTREWPYKDVPKRIIAEPFLSDGRGSDLTDYKFYCFNGEPIFCQVISDRRTIEKVDFFDMEWVLQPFTGIMLPHKPHSSNSASLKPRSFDEMKKASAVLAKDIPFVRIDYYDVNGKMYFGEITFYPGSGFGYYEPEKWNEILGSYINLDSVK